VNSRVVGVLTILLLVSACGSSGQEEQPEPTIPTSSGAAATQGGADPITPVVTDTIARDLAAPWSLVFLPDGSALVTERDTAEIKRLTPTDNGWASSSALTIGDVNNDGEGGLMGLAVKPSEPDDTTVSVYVYWSTDEDNRVGVMTWDGQELSEPEVIVDGIPHASIHNGGRIAFGPDGNLYIATGDAGQTGLAQDETSLAGKVLRVTATGEPVDQNPDPDSPVYSLGHRNIQGLAFDEEGQLWASEFGSSEADEFNLIEAGGNYGWPIYEGAGGDPDYIDPVVQWEPTAIASPSGMTIASGWGWVAGLRGQTLWQVPLDPEIRVASSVAWFEDEFGRLRDVIRTPEGTLWLITNNTDGRGNPGSEDDRILEVQLRPGG
jgi:glucose/arabinose dehydrogenase